MQQSPVPTLPRPQAQPPPRGLKRGRRAASSSWPPAVAAVRRSCSLFFFSFDVPWSRWFSRIHTANQHTTVSIVWVHTGPAPTCARTRTTGPSGSGAGWYPISLNRRTGRVRTKRTRARSRIDGCPGPKDAELPRALRARRGLPFARASTCRRLPEAGETRDAKPKAPKPNSTRYLHRCHVRLPSPRPPLLAPVSSPAKGGATGSGLATFVQSACSQATGIATPAR
jgi:hypothetical protein